MSRIVSPPFFKEGAGVVRVHIQEQGMECQEDFYSTTTRSEQTPSRSEKRIKYMPLP